MIFSKCNKPLKGNVTIPGDKSISHRAIMFGALADGTTEITNFLQGADCLSTIACFKKLGIQIDNTPTKICVHGNGLYGLKKPSSILDTGNSGTTTRLISGILSAQKFDTALTGDASIQKRPMKRIMEPLSQMGAEIVSLNQNDCVPFHIFGKKLHGIDYISKVASAQVKSAILLAGLYAEGITRVTEPSLSRNHSELMLHAFGADISSDHTTATVKTCHSLHAQKVEVPGDISSAAYFIAAALLVPGSELCIKNVGINPTRAGIIQVVKQMGGTLELLNSHISSGEEVADLLVSYSRLHAVTIEGDMIPTLIDELPIIAILAAAAEGTTVIRDAAELKVKESNRIDTMVTNLSAFGCHVLGTDDGLIIEGTEHLTGACIDSFFDHRIAMSFAIASLIAEGNTEILHSECVDISYPNFYKDLYHLAT